MNIQSECIHIAISAMIIGIGSKFKVCRPCCAARSAAKIMESNYAAANCFKV